MEIALIKKYAAGLGMSEVMGGPEQIVMSFDQNNLPDMQRIIDVMGERKDLFMTNPSQPKLRFKMPKPTIAEEAEYLKKICQLMESLYEEEGAEN